MSNKPVSNGTDVAMLCAEKKTNIQTGESITFRTEMGIPATKTGDDLTVRGSANGNREILYAYKKENDTTETVAGKLNVLSFDEQHKKVYLVQDMTQIPKQRLTRKGVIICGNGMISKILQLNMLKCTVNVNK
jgi:hypothetical protein